MTGSLWSQSTPSPKLVTFPFHCPKKAKIETFRRRRKATYQTSSESVDVPLERGRCLVYKTVFTSDRFAMVPEYTESQVGDFSFFTAQKKLRETFRRRRKATYQTSSESVDVPLEKGRCLVYKTVFTSDRFFRVAK